MLSHVPIYDQENLYWQESHTFPFRIINVFIGMSVHTTIGMCFIQIPLWGNWKFYLFTPAECCIHNQNYDTLSVICHYPFFILHCVRNSMNLILQHVTHYHLKPAWNFSASTMNIPLNSLNSYCCYSSAPGGFGLREACPICWIWDQTAGMVRIITDIWL